MIRKQAGLIGGCFRDILPEDMREQRPFGKHELYVEDDLLMAVPHGEVTNAEFQFYAAAADRIIAEYGYLLILGDERELNAITADARRRMTQWSIGKPILGLALFNAGLAARSLTSLIIKALNMLRKHTVPFAFFKSETEARAWIAGLRKSHLAQQGTSPAQHSSTSPGPAG